MSDDPGKPPVTILGKLFGPKASGWAQNQQGAQNQFSNGVSANQARKGGWFRK
jgi:hypothetical protein